MNITDDFLRSFQKTIVLRENFAPSCVKYSPLGTSASISVQNTLKTYNTISGTLMNSLSIKPTSFDYITENCIVHTSDTSLKYLSLYDSTYISTFYGHTSPVKSVISCNLNDTFGSFCEDFVKIWDIRCLNPTFSIPCRNGTLAFVNENYFTVKTGQTILFYDKRNITGPIKKRFLEIENDKNFLTFQDNDFLANEKFVILNQGGNKHLILDLNLELFHTINTHKKSKIEFLPGLDYYLISSGSIIYIYDTQKKLRFGNIRDNNLLEIGEVLFNPVYAQFISVNNGISFWMPQQID